MRKLQALLNWILVTCLWFCLAGCVETSPLPGVEERSIWANLQEKPEYSTLVLGLQRTGLNILLAENGPVTLFAPDNDAFILYLSNQPVNNVATMPLADLRSLLLFHLTPGRLLTKSMTSGTIPTLLSGQRLNVTVSKNNVVLDRTSNLVEPDQEGVNGTIHYVDRILVPDANN